MHHGNLDKQINGTASENNLAQVPSTLLLKECEEISKYYGQGWFASRADYLINDIKTKLKAGLSYINSQNYNQAIGEFRKCENDNDEIIAYVQQNETSNYRKLPDLTLNNIAFLIAFCEYKQNRIEAAFVILKKLKQDAAKVHGLDSLYAICFETIRTKADNIINKYNISMFNKQTNIIACKKDIQQALSLYKFLETKSTSQHLISTMLNKLAWLEICDAVQAQTLNIMLMVQTERDQQRLLQHIQQCIQDYEKYQLVLDAEQQQSLHRLRQLVLSVETKLQSESIDANRKNIRVLRAEIPNLILQGNLPKALKNLVTIKKSADIVVNACQTEDPTQGILDLEPAEYPEFYSAAIQKLRSEYDQYMARAKSQIPDLCKKIITDALKFLPSSTVEKKLSSIDLENLIQNFTLRLQDNWFKFDRHDKFAFSEKLLLLSKNLSLCMSWTLGVQTSLRFRGYNVYISDRSKVERLIQDTITSYVPEENPPIIEIPIFTSTTVPVGDLQIGDLQDNPNATPAPM